MPVVVRRVLDDGDFAIAGRLIGEYVAWLGIDLAFQDFEREIADLPSKYRFPASGLFLARIGDFDVGCAGFAPFRAEGACELKRLYIRPQARGAGAGNALLAAATKLYRSAGFTETSASYANPVPGAIFFRKALREPRLPVARGPRVSGRGS